MSDTNPKSSMTLPEILARLERMEPLLREAATVLDEPFHHDAIAVNLCEAADALSAAREALSAQGGEKADAVIARIREVYPFDRKPCAWCNSRKSHHYDCPAPDIHALLELLRPSPPTEEN